MGRIYAALLLLGVMFCFIAGITPSRFANTMLSTIGTILIVVALTLIATDPTW